MASSKIVFFAVTLLVAACCAKLSENKISIKIPDECKKNGFCSVKPEGYDELEDRINELLPPDLIKSFADRIGQDTKTELSAESDWHNCPYIKKVDSSYIYNYNNLTKHDLIIQTKFFNQPIESITCAYDKIESGGQECFQHLKLNQFNMESSCQTSTSKRSLLVYDFETDSIVQKDYNVPCCCTCQISSSL